MSGGLAAGRAFSLRHAGRPGERTPVARPSTFHSALGSYRSSITAAGRTSGPVTRVVAAARHPVVLAGLRHVLAGRSDITLVGATGDDAELRRLLSALRPDVVLLDGALSRHPDGLVALSADIARECPHSRVVVYLDDGDHCAPPVPARCEVVVKSESIEELVSALIEERPADRVPRGYGREASGESRVAALTPRERAVLDLMIRGLVNTAIGDELGIAASTVKYHVGNIIRKLDCTGRVGVARVAARADLAGPDGRA